MGEGDNVTATHCNGVELFRLTTIKHNSIGLTDDQVFDGRHPTANQKKLAHWLPLGTPKLGPDPRRSRFRMSTNKKDHLAAAC